MREAVKGLSRSGEGAAFTGLLTKTEFDLGSCFPLGFHMEGPSSGYLGGVLFLLVLITDVVRLLRYGSECDN